MATVLLARILSITLHLTILGSLVDVDLQLHNGRLRDALVHTAVISVCILMLAVTGYVATKLLSRHAADLQIVVTRVPIEQARTRRAPQRRKASANPKRKSNAKRQASGAK